MAPVPAFYHLPHLHTMTPRAPKFIWTVEDWATEGS